MNPLEALIHLLLWNAMVEQVDEAHSSECMINLSGDSLLIRVGGLEEGVKVYQWDCIISVESRLSG